MPESSSVLVLGILILGALLALARPYFAFLFGALIVASFPIGDLAQARTFLGPYFNAFDATVIITCLAVLIEASRTRRILFPWFIIAITLLLVVAFVQTSFRLGITYETIRAFRWAATFPIFIFVARNMLIDAERAKLLLLILLIGAFLNSLQAITFVASRLDVYIETENYALVRSAKLLSSNHYVLLAMSVWIVPQSGRQRAGYIALGILLVVATIFSQTRSSWIALLASLPIMLAVFQSPQLRIRNLIRFALIATFLTLMSVLIIELIVPQLSPIGVIEARIAELADPEGSIASRRLAFDYEWQAWLDSPIFVGQGLSYFQEDYGSGVAINHLGYLTYLAQLGLFGFLLLGIYIPLSTLFSAAKVARNYPNSDYSNFAILTGASIIYSSILFLMSGSLLSHAPILGILVGGIMSYTCKINRNGTVVAGKHFGDDDRIELQRSK